MVFHILLACLVAEALLPAATGGGCPALVFLCFLMIVSHFTPLLVAEAPLPVATGGGGLAPDFLCFPMVF